MEHMQKESKRCPAAHESVVFLFSDTPLIHATKECDAPAAASCEVCRDAEERGGVRVLQRNLFFRWGKQVKKQNNLI